MVETIKSKKPTETDETGYPKMSPEQLSQVNKTWNPKDKEELAKVFRWPRTRILCARDISGGSLTVELDPDDASTPGLGVGSSPAPRSIRTAG